MADSENGQSTQRITRQPAKKLQKIGVQPTAIELAESLLELAGVSKEERVRLVRRTIEAQEEALDATLVKIASKDGIISDERSYTDHQTRLKAAGELQQVLGLDKKPGRERESGAPIINILVAPFAQPESDDKSK